MKSDISNKASTQPQQRVVKKALEKRITNLTADVKFSQDIIDTVREPFLVLNGTLHIVTANPAFYRMFKVLKKNTEGTLLYEIGDHQWDIPELRKLLENVLPKKKVFNDFEVLHVFPKIGQKTMLLNARRIDHAQLILLAIEDITEQKQLEDLKKRNDKRFRALIEKSADAIALVNQRGKVLYASPSTKNVIGYAPEEFKKLTNPFDLVPPDDRKLVTELFAELLKQPGSDRHIVYRIKHKNGKLIWIESVMTNMISDPNVGAVVINYRDMSQRKALETQKDDFIGIASHELKTPVTSLKAYTQILQKKFEKYGDPVASQNLVKMEVQINKLSALIGDLLDVTKIESGKIVFNKNLFVFDPMVAVTVDELQLTTDKHKIRINGEVKMQVYADKERIGLVLTNFLTNAIKYSPDADKVVVHLSVDDDMVIVGVQDFGIGIPAENLATVFDRFYRVKSPKGDTYPGLGLGLYISAEIIKRHTGKVWVNSEVGKGSTFYFAIPIKEKSKPKGLRVQDGEEEIKHG